MVRREKKKKIFSFGIGEVPFKLHMAEKNCSYSTKSSLEKRCQVFTEGPKSR